MVRNMMWQCASGCDATCRPTSRPVADAPHCARSRWCDVPQRVPMASAADGVKLSQHVWLQDGV